MTNRILGGNTIAVPGDNSLEASELHNHSNEVVFPKPFQSASTRQKSKILVLGASLSMLVPGRVQCPAALDPAQLPAGKVAPGLLSPGTS